LAWFIINFKEARNLFHHNFWACLLAHPLGFRGVNHWIIIKVQQEVIQWIISRIWAWGHMLTMEFANLVTIKEKGRIKKGIRKIMKTHDSKTCLLFAYHPIATTII
jgi:hypothetical protein